METDLNKLILLKCYSNPSAYNVQLLFENLRTVFFTIEDTSLKCLNSEKRN